MGRLRRAAAGAPLVLLLACSNTGAEQRPGPGGPSGATPSGDVGTTTPAPDEATPAAEGGGPEVTLAFAGDVHFEGVLADLAASGRTLGPISRTLRSADLAVLNLETALTTRGERDPKELENAGDRYHFRAPARALDVLARSGVDVVSVANNHAGDYGRVGLTDTLAAGRRSRVAMVGAGADEAEAFTPHVRDVGGLDVAVLAADSVQREGSSDVWRARPDAAGIAAARGSRTAALRSAVQDAARAADVVVVYLHWGKEYEACPTQSQRLLVRELSEAGADVIVGSHSHVLAGAGWAGDTYVAYGLGNFAWYHARQADTGVLTLRVGADGVRGERWTPARISATDGLPRAVAPARRQAAERAWRTGTRCAGLGGSPGETQADDPAYEASVERIDDDLAARMSRSHRSGCPVPLADLRHLRVTHRGLAGRARTGELVVHRRWARDVVGAFERLYDAGWPIARMRLVDAYGADDEASMAANNTSAFNCRRVAGTRTWSAHAYGAAIDLNPVQNPYVRPGSVQPPAGRRHVGIDRTRSADVPLGAIRDGGLAVRAFGRIGWEWGGRWASPDYQHLASRTRP